MYKHNEIINAYRVVFAVLFSLRCFSVFSVLPPTPAARATPGFALTTILNKKKKC